jgi:hypothetical protein
MSRTTHKKRRPRSHLLELTDANLHREGGAVLAPGDKSTAKRNAGLSFLTSGFRPRRRRQEPRAAKSCPSILWQLAREKSLVARRSGNRGQFSQDSEGVIQNEQPPEFLNSDVGAPRCCIGSILSLLGLLPGVQHSHAGKTLGRLSTGSLRGAGASCRPVKPLGGRERGPCCRSA